MKTIRETREEIEKATFSPYACLSAESKGRKIPEEKCAIRTDFQRDRDRILYSKSFRRLMHKTQVFIAPEGDHYRTRLTHTLEVSQIARTIARGLRLNEDLTEAIALGHDLGHAPFGHAGEKALNKLMKETVCGDFHHAQQSLRVVDFLERDGGLNLTEEVRNGILSHTKGKCNIEDKCVFAEPMTLEADVVRISDRLAYINHDIDDAIRAKIIDPEDVPTDLRHLFGEGLSQRVHTMVMDIIESSWDKPEIVISPQMAQGLDDLKNFMYEKVYVNSIAKVEEPKAMLLVEQLFKYFIRRPTLIPPYIIERGSGCKLAKMPVDIFESVEHINCSLPADIDDLELRAQAVCDYIAGMTDRFAVATHTNIFVPAGWREEALSRQ